ncbi:hypothetical protein TrST_g9067 [Triparma strigata]|uniref:WW domain-containing protein n=1 Tax=Triparma strigata TaxID=1606541 RepID=A0A9W6ZL78_9STRA|nr:hypothetical protein TrST_g9067 [Triparma strigata]
MPEQQFSEQLHNWVDENPWATAGIVVGGFAIFGLCTFWLSDVSAFGCFCFECYYEDSAYLDDESYVSDDEDVEVGYSKKNATKAPPKTKVGSNALNRKSGRRASRRRMSSVAEVKQKISGTKIRTRGFSVKDAVTVTTRKESKAKPLVKKSAEPQKMQMVKNEDVSSLASKDEWEAKVDPASQQTYYENKRTKRTTWTAPSGHLTSKEAASGDWEEKLDPASGQKYYENKRTGRKTWSPQQLATAVNALGHGNASTSDWVEKFDEVHQHKYYENVKTGEKTWTAPSVAAPPGGEWERKIDPASGHPYFENTRTRQKTWTDHTGPERTQTERASQMSKISEGS